MNELPISPETRAEKLLGAIASGDKALPVNPETRKERMLAAIAEGRKELPFAPETREEQLLGYIVENGAGGAEAEPLSVTANGTYDAGEGKAYNPVTVAVPDAHEAYTGALTVTPTKQTQTLATSGKAMPGDVTVDPIPAAYIVPEGTLEITENGTADVTGYASVNVNAAGWETAPESWATGLIDGTLSGSVYGSMVLSVRSFAFSDCRKITNVEFTVCVLIEESAFHGCSALTAVSFPVCTFIGSSALYYCTALTTAYFPTCVRIGNNAFQGCSALTTISFPACTTIGGSAFFGCSALTTAYFPTCARIVNSAFLRCTALTTASFPACTTIGSGAFSSCSYLTTASFPACTTIGSSAFHGCSALTTVSFPACTLIESGAFQGCYHLMNLYLTGSSVCTLRNSSAFTSTPIGGYSDIAGKLGSIYVPASLLASYKAMASWVFFSSQFVGV